MQAYRSVIQMKYQSSKWLIKYSKSSLGFHSFYCVGFAYDKKTLIALSIKKKMTPLEIVWLIFPCLLTLISAQ